MSIAHFLLLYLKTTLTALIISPRPTPEVVESISANAHAHDCMEVMNRFSLILVIC